MYAFKSKAVKTTTNNQIFLYKEICQE